MKGKEISQKTILETRKAIEQKGVPPENIEAYIHIFRKLSGHIKQYKKNNKIQNLKSLREEHLSWLKKAKGNGFKPDSHLFYEAYNDMALEGSEFFSLDVFIMDFLRTSWGSSDFARHFLEHALSWDLFHFAKRYHDKLVHDFVKDSVLSDDSNKNMDVETFRRRRNRRKKELIIIGLIYYHAYLKRKGETLLDSLPKNPQGYLKELVTRLQIVPPDAYKTARKPFKIPTSIQLQASSLLQEGRFLESSEQKTQK